MIFTKKVAYVVLLLGLMLGFGPLYASAVPLLSIEPPITTVQPNQNFSLNVLILDVTDLYAFQFDLEFDPLLLSATSVAEGSFLPSGGATVFLPGSIDNSIGALTLTSDTLVGAIPGASGSGIIAIIDFQALTTVGTSPTTLSNIFLLDSGLGDITVSTIDNGFVTVHEATAIPEPATWLLLATGLVGLLAFRWRRRQRVV